MGRPLTWLDVFTSVPLAGNGLCVVHDADDQDGLVAAADAAMYDAKRAGKNRAMRAQRDHSL